MAIPRRRLSLLAAILVLPPGAAGAAVSVTVSPPRVSLAPAATIQFSATVGGASNQAVAWLVNGVPGGAPSIGSISASGLYTAPTDVPSPLQVEIEAQAAASAQASGAAQAEISASSGTGPTFFVATSGNDANPGSAGQPWKTIQHAVDTVPPGATIQVHGGVYNALVTITRSGSAAAGYITLEPVPGEAPVIDGTGLAIPNGENGLITLSNASYIRIAGLELRNYTSHSAALDPVGIYVIGGGSNIEILGNHIHDIVTTVTTSAGDALGMAIYGSSKAAPLANLVIDGNELDHLTTGFSESLALSGNVTFWQVTNNKIHDNDNIGIDMAGAEGVVNDPALDRARNGLVEGNLVYNITSKHNPAYHDQLGADGIYVDGGADITIQRNLVHDADLGIELASEHKGHVADHIIARNNVVYSSNLVGISIGGYANGVGGTTNCTITNNSLYNNDTSRSGSGEFQIQFHASNNRFFNNILYANNQGLLVNSFVATAADPVGLNNNIYYASGGSSNAQWRWLGKFYSTLAAFQSHSGQDGRTKFADPRYASLSTDNLDILSGSPAIGQGFNLGLAAIGLTDFAGNPRLPGTTLDAGAYQP